MTLQSSGAISLNDVNVELAVAGTSLISLNDGNVRSLFQVLTGAISMSDGYGKTSLASLHFTATTTETNLRTWAINAGWTGSSRIEVFVDSGVWVYSDAPGVSAMTIDGSWPLGLTLYNNGIIMGMGGNGAGSDAINTSISYTMYATNYILGGGGQGGNGGGGGAGGGLSNGQGVGWNAGNANGSAQGGRNPLGSNTPNSVINGKANYTCYGGGAGGGGGCNWDCQNWQTRGGYGGGNANAGGAYAIVQGSPAIGQGGGGGYGATGGTGRQNSANVAGSAGGRGIRLNSNSVTWPNGQPNNLIRGGVGN